LQVENGDIWMELYPAECACRNFPTFVSFRSAPRITYLPFMEQLLLYSMHLVEIPVLISFGAGLELLTMCRYVWLPHENNLY